jgi:dCMP deaminase
MPCFECGSSEIVTSAGLCRICAGKTQQRSFVYAPYLADASMGTKVRDLGRCSICGQEWSLYMPCPHLTARLKERQMQRMPWDEYFLELCKTVSRRSIDVETQNGSVIINEHKRIVSTGYNAFPAGVDDSFWPRDRETKARVPKVAVDRRASLGDVPFHVALRTATEPQAWLQGWLNQDRFYEVDKYMAMTHAEMNAVVAAGQDLHGCTVYTLLFPCHECAKAIITSGIKRVVFTVTREDPSWAVAKELFIQAGVEMTGPEKP